MQQVSVFIIPNTRNQLITKQDITIAIDAIRCSTTIIYAFLQGVKAVIPATTINDAKRLHKLTPDSFLAGERYAKKIKGFDFNNSPFELHSSHIKNQKMIITTTNGTRLIQWGIQKSHIVLVGALINAHACAELAAEKSRIKGRDVKILIPWMRGGVALEDLYTAGLISTYLLEKGFSPYLDTIIAATLIAQIPFEKMVKEMANSWSAQKIIEVGYQSDLDYCLAINSTELVPFSRDKHIQTS